VCGTRAGPAGRSTLAVVAAPFAGLSSFVLVLPAGDPHLGGDRRLLELEAGEFEAVLGAPATFAEHDPGWGPRLVLRVDQSVAVPEASLDPDGPCLRLAAADTAGVLAALSLLPTLLRAGSGTVRASEAATLAEAVERVAVEVADSYPSFALRGLDWDAICARHGERVREADDPVAALQRWLAELEDAHTWAVERPAPGALPYALRVDGDATFARVPAGSAAHAAGVRCGWRLVSMDDAAPDLRDWWARVGATAHAKPFVVGRRLLAADVERERAYVAEGPAGERATWVERARHAPDGDLVRVGRPERDVGYVAIDAWIPERGIDDALDAAFADLAGCRRLVLDLRGNPGGNLVLACATRDRFLDGETTVGTVRYRSGGLLSRPFPLVARPSDRRRWAGEVLALTDPLTYSACEDFLLGLRARPRAHVVGAPSGGGSGRPRLLPLLTSCDLRVSTALTFDRHGRCVEGAGIAVDVVADPFAGGPDGHDLALAVAVGL
jgi:carboxyl-terminal processing protease